MAKNNATNDTSEREDIFRVKVFSPFETFVDTKAISLSAENEAGPFDILARHANFLTLLIPCTLKIVTPENELDLPVQRAVLHVRDNVATVFLGI